MPSIAGATPPGSPAAARAAPWRARLARSLETLRGWPWFDTLRTLRQRFREDNLGLTAGSLTFTTLIALVPLVTVMLAVFSAFPMFANLQGALEKYFLQALVPDSIARPVLSSLTQFAAKARALGTASLVVLVLSALSLVLTIDRTLNRIWRVRRPRPFAQRVLVYWAALTLGPLVLAMSLSFASYALSASRGWAQALPGDVNLLFDLLEFALVAVAAAGLYRYVPNAPVRWAHAWGGAMFVAVGLELAKRGLGWYLKSIPGFSAMYGAFATVPILLLWVYLLWVVVLLGAVGAAYAPSLAMRAVRRTEGPGQRFELALALLAELERSRRAGRGGASSGAMAAALRTDPLQVESVLESLVALNWVARLDEDGVQGEARVVLLCEPQTTPAAPLVDGLLQVPGGAAASAFRRQTRLDSLMLADILDDAGQPAG